MLDRDPTLRRIERDAVFWCLGSAVVALVLRGGRPGVALAVGAGGLLVGVSYWATRSGVDALLATTVERAEARRPARLAWALVKLAGRYALLALMAYVMIARLRLHPIGLLVGASSVVAAAGIEAIRLTVRFGASRRR